MGAKAASVAEITNFERSEESPGWQRVHGESPATSRVESAETSDKVFFWLFVAGLAWCPIWFGSNDILAWGINAVLFPGLAIVYELSLLVGGRRHAFGVHHLKVPAAFMCLVVLWIVIQNATWTPGVLHHPIWGMTAEALGKSIEGSISVNRDLTTLALVRLVTSVSVFWLALQLCRHAGRAQMLLASMAVVGCLYAAYGIFALATMPGKVLWVDRASGRGFVSSTFINQNSYATYAGIGLVIAVAFALRLYRRKMLGARGPLKFRLASFIETTGREGIYLLGAVFLMFVALLLTGSRGGIIASAFGVAVLVALSLRRNNGNPDWRATAIVAAAFGALTLLVFGDLLLSRLFMSGVADGNRLAVYLMTLRSIASTPLLGYGYGTFPDVFPMFRDGSLSVGGRWLQAHNTYLEIFQGLGLVFGCIFIISVAVPILRCVKAAGSRKESAMVPAVAASVGLLVSLHALVDFSLQIQAVALTFAALLGAGVAQSVSSRSRTGD